MDRKQLNSVMLGLFIMGIFFFSLVSVVTAANEVTIELSEDAIKVDGELITEDSNQAVFLQKKIETHPSVKKEYEGVENKVVTISRGGTYSVSGSITDTQLLIAAGDKDELTLILNGVEISCRTAPAILVESAFDPQEAGKSGVTLMLADNCTNVVTGSRVEEDEDVPGSPDYDAAISSKISITIDGNGDLTVNSDNEGIESQMHLTINNGCIRINSQDDAINASNDNVSWITINGGRIIASAANGSEGDAIDSNGGLTINNATIIARAYLNSMDSGLDAEFGTQINSGTVVALGNMEAMISSDKQGVITLNLDQPVENLAVMDADGIPMMIVDQLAGYRNITLSSAELTAGTYTIYVNGKIDGEGEDGLYWDFYDYTDGVLLQHSNSGGGLGPQFHRNPMNMDPSNRNHPGGLPMDEESTEDADHPLVTDDEINVPLAPGPVMPEKTENQPNHFGHGPAVPAGAEGKVVWPDGMKPSMGGDAADAEPSTDFVLAEDQMSATFFGVRPVESK